MVGPSMALELKLVTGNNDQFLLRLTVCHEDDY
jgi:hypothetical protein